MAVTVCAICLEPLTTGGALTPVHAACLGCWHPAEVQEIDRIEATQEGGQIVAVKAEAVKDCPACCNLCDLISARRHARKMWGVAKRAVRVAGKHDHGRRAT